MHSFNPSATMSSTSTPASPNSDAGHRRSPSVPSLASVSPQDPLSSLPPAPPSLPPRPRDPRLRPRPVNVPAATEYFTNYIQGRGTQGPPPGLRLTAGALGLHTGAPMGAPPISPTDLELPALEPINAFPVPRAPSPDIRTSRSVYYILFK